MGAEKWAPTHHVSRGGYGVEGNDIFRMGDITVCLLVGIIQ